MDVRRSGSQETTGSSATSIILACVLAGVLFASIVAGVSVRKRAQSTAADLETAMAELSVQRSRAVSLQQQLNSRDAFIDRNVLQGPDVYSAAPPPIQSREPVPEEDVIHADPFAVGSEVDADSFTVGSEDESSDEESSEDESDDSGSDDDESVESSLDIAIELPQSPTVMSAIRVRPSEIKTITVLSKGWLSQEFDLETAITGDCQTPKDELWHEVKMEESPKDHSSLPLPVRDDSQHQVDCYWGEDTVESPQGEAPSLAEGEEGPAEVETATTEVDRAKDCNKDVGATPAPIVSSSSGSPPEGPDTPESSMLPSGVQACHYPLWC